MSPNYDAFVSDGQDNVLVAITGKTGTGIAVIDLTSVPERPPLPYSTNVAKFPLQRPFLAQHITNQTVLVHQQTAPRQ